MFAKSLHALNISIFSYFSIISGISVFTSRDMGYLEKIFIGIFATLLKGI